MSQLYDVVQKWDAMSTSVPQVVQRLVAVKELHEQGETSQLKMLYIVSKLLKQEHWARASCWSEFVMAKQLGQSIFGSAALVLGSAVVDIYRRCSKATGNIGGSLLHWAMFCWEILGPAIHADATLTHITCLSIVTGHDTSIQIGVFNPS